MTAALLQVKQLNRADTVLKVSAASLLLRDNGEMPQELERTFSREVND